MHRLQTRDHAYLSALVPLAMILACTVFILSTRAGAAPRSGLAKETHAAVAKITERTVSFGVCPAPPAEQSGYHTALAGNLQDLQDVTAVLDSAGWLVHGDRVDASCWALVYCDPEDRNSGCWDGG